MPFPELGLAEVKAEADTPENWSMSWKRGSNGTRLCVVGLEVGGMVLGSGTLQQAAPGWDIV